MFSFCRKFAMVSVSVCKALGDEGALGKFGCPELVMKFDKTQRSSTYDNVGSFVISLVKHLATFSELSSLAFGYMFLVLLKQCRRFLKIRHRKKLNPRCVLMIRWAMTFFVSNALECKLVVLFHHVHSYALMGHVYTLDCLKKLLSAPAAQGRCPAGDFMFRSVKQQ